MLVYLPPVCQLFANLLPTVFQLFANFLPTVGHLFANYLPMVCPLFANCLPTVCPLLANFFANQLPTVSKLFANCSPTVCQLFAHCFPWGQLCIIQDIQGAFRVSFGVNFVGYFRTGILEHFIKFYDNRFGYFSKTIKTMIFLQKH